MDNNGHFWMVYNDQAYNSELYGDKSISKRSNALKVNLSSRSNEILAYAFQQHHLESEERYLGDGFLPYQTQFHTFIEGTKTIDGFSEGSYGGFQIEMSLDEVYHQR